MKRVSSRPRISLLALALLLGVGPHAGLQAMMSAALSPTAKSRAEFDAYNSANALTGARAIERAADDFAARFPTSELRVLLYRSAMHEYQEENDKAGMLASGDKVLAIDPSDLIALVLTATVESDTLGEGGDRQRAIEEVKVRASKALSLVDSSEINGASGKQLEDIRSTLKSIAHSALGVLALKTDDFAAAETHFEQAAKLNIGSPDPYIWYHLSLAEDHLGKYRAALDAVTKALALSHDVDLVRLAEGERNRLQGKLDSGQAH